MRMAILVPSASSARLSKRDRGANAFDLVGPLSWVLPQVYLLAVRRISGARTLGSAQTCEKDA